MSSTEPPPGADATGAAVRDARGRNARNCCGVGRTTTSGRVWIASTSAAGPRRVALAEALAQARTPAIPPLAIRKEPAIATSLLVSMMCLLASSTFLSDLERKDQTRSLAALAAAACV